MAPNAVTASEIASGAVGNTELANGAVTNAKLANCAVGYINISSSAVGTGAAQVAQGNHAHFGYASSVHTHAVTISSSGAHGHVGQSGAHAHTGTTGQPSSRRFKTDIAEYMPEDLQKILQLNLHHQNDNLIEKRN